VSAFEWRSVEGWAEGFFVSMLKQMAQALELRLLVESLLTADPARFLVVAGDFNSEDRAPALRLVQAAEEDVGASRLAGHGLVLLDRYLPEDRSWSVLQRFGKTHGLIHKRLIVGFQVAEPTVKGSARQDMIEHRRPAGSCAQPAPTMRRSSLSSGLGMPNPRSASMTGHKIVLGRVANFRRPGRSVAHRSVAAGLARYRPWHRAQESSTSRSARARSACL